REKLNSTKDHADISPRTQGSSPFVSDNNIRLLHRITSEVILALDLWTLTILIALWAPINISVACMQYGVPRTESCSMTACQNRQIRCQALGTRHIVQLSWLILLHELRLVHSNYCQTPLPPISSRHVNQLLSQALS
ncbi:hypothetical protein T310_8767, partial [Rasamsonia emersonii CBS 393.64]